MKYIVFDCDGTLVDTSAPKYKLFPGIEELLQTLSSTCRLYVWTARGRRSTQTILQDLGIYSFFDEMMTPDDCFSKPHTEGLIRLVGDLPKNSICVIGDTAHDILGAKNFSVLALGATWNKSGQDDYLRGAGADFIVSHPSECSRIIEQNLSEASSEET